MTKFIGYSTTAGKITRLQDVKLAIRDLENYFYTPYGSRLGEPDYGSRIRSFLMEMNDDILAEFVEEDVRRGISLDPRWRLLSVSVSSENHSITVGCSIEYLPNKTPQELILQFDRD